MKCIKARVFLGLNLLWMMGGCVSQQYVWRDYDEDLQSYYDHPNERDKLMKAIRKTLDQGEAQHRVPPGLCAEYGYLLFESGDHKLALQYYEKEKVLWPESAFFMDKILKNAANKTANTVSQSSENGVH